MKKIIIIATIALGFNLGISAEMRINVFTKPLPEDVKEELKQREPTSQYIRTPIPLREKGSRYFQTAPIYLRVGEKSEQIKLEYPGVPGYSWQYACDPDNALEVTVSDEKKSIDTMMATHNAMNTKVFSVTGKKAGKIMCTFSYKDSSQQVFQDNTIKTQAFIVTE